MLTHDFKVGDVVKMDHDTHGPLGELRIDRKAGNAVRIAFDMPREVVIRVIRRLPSSSFGISGQDDRSVKGIGLPKPAV